jgi:hypothetical protein
VTYRDDHQAALERIAALEKELAEAREEATAATAILARSERERARLSAELERKRTPHSVEVGVERTRAILPVDADRVPSGRRLQPVNPKLAVYLVVMALLGLIAGVLRALSD